MTHPVRELPVFPLGNPAIPYAGFPLHVFEDRYRALMREVMASDRRFGIVMIERGSEVGGGEARSDVGVIVEVADAEELEDGRWAVLVVGMARFRVVDWLPDDPFPRALVEELVEPETTPEFELRDEIEAMVRRIAGMLTELGEPAAPISVVLDPDPVVAGWQAVAVTPTGPLDLQRLIEIDDPDVRLAAIRAVLADAEELIRLRIGA